MAKPKGKPKAKRPPSNPNNLKHNTSTGEMVIVDTNAEALNQGNVVVIQNTAGKQIIDKTQTQTEGASATQASHTTTEKEVATVVTNFDPLTFMKQKHSKVVVTTAPNKKRQEAPLLLLDPMSVAHAAMSRVATMSPPFKKQKPISTENVASIPDAVVTTPQLTTSSNISTLSKQNETQQLPAGIHVTDAAHITPGEKKHINGQSSNPFYLRVKAVATTTLVNTVKTCVKTHTFRICKFYNRNLHSPYNSSAQTMCGQILRKCNLDADAAWWYQMLPTVVKTLTDHRNNCIKRINARFKASGKGEEHGYQYCMLMNGSDEHVRKMLGMRNDILFYSEFLDHYAPAVVGNLTWNDDAKMNAHCCTTDLRTFAKHILSVSDEAFIILVLVNAARRWMYEISRDKSMEDGTWTEDSNNNMPVPKYTHSRLTNSGGSGWTKEGKEFFNELQDFVANDRLKHASDASGSNTTTSLTFNKALLQRFQERRNRERKGNDPDKIENSTKKKKPTPYHCFDAFADESDDDDDANATTNEQPLFSLENVTSYDEV